MSRISFPKETILSREKYIVVINKSTFSKLFGTILLAYREINKNMEKIIIFFNNVIILSLVSF